MEAKALVLALLTTAAVVLGDDQSCKITGTLDHNIVKKIESMEKHCVKQMEEQIHMEIEAAMTYLSMAAHFSRDSVNLPGFAKFFFKSASEEREHAIKLIDYLLMRNELINADLTKITVTRPKTVSIGTGAAALNSALALEINVTDHIRKVIIECEKETGINPDKKFNNDYHLVDYLSGDFLTEQYQGQKDLASLIMTLTKMMDNHGHLGEFLFDKKLLMGELF